MLKLRNPDRTDIAKRLKRAAGHLNAELGTIDKRPSVALAQQLAAVEAAISSARQEVVSRQMQAFLQSGDAENGTLRQLQALARYLTPATKAARF